MFDAQGEVVSTVQIVMNSHLVTGSKSDPVWSTYPLTRQKHESDNSIIPISCASRRGITF